MTKAVAAARPPPPRPQKARRPTCAEPGMGAIVSELPLSRTAWVIPWVLFLRSFPLPVVVACCAIPVLLRVTKRFQFLFGPWAFSHGMLMNVSSLEPPNGAFAFYPLPLGVRVLCCVGIIELCSAGSNSVIIPFLFLNSANRSGQMVRCVLCTKFCGAVGED